MNANIPALAVFAVFIMATLSITMWAARRTRSASQFWAASHALTPRQNALAVFGDIVSAASFMGTSGLIFLYGLDGVFYIILPTLSMIPLVLVFVERLRNLGKFTLTDVLVSRFHKPALRRLVACSTLLITVFFFSGQLVAAGSLFQLLAGVPFSVAVVIAGLLTLTYVTFGGMLATTWVQIIKAGLLLIVFLVLFILVLASMTGGFNDWLTSALTPTGSVNPLAPGNLIRNPWNTVSVGLAMMFGIAGLPHMMIRLFTVRDAVDARRSITMATYLVITNAAMVVILGLAARDLLKEQADWIARNGGNLTLPTLVETLGGGAGSIGGTLVLSVVVAVAFATILAVTSGLLITSASAIVRDLWRPSHVYKSVSAETSSGSEVKTARVVSVVISIVMASIVIALGPSFNATVLVTFGFSIAASSNFPVLVLSLFWRRFTVQGAISGICVGLASAGVVLLLGPTLWLGSDPAPLSLTDPTIISMPMGFIAAIVASLLSRRDTKDDFDGLQLRALLGHEVVSQALGNRSLNQ